MFVAPIAKELRPRYHGDEVAVGVSLAFALHAIPALLVVVGVLHPLSSLMDDTSSVAQPIIAANVLKLGKPPDPNKLPDRLVPVQHTAPKKDLLASKDPLKAPPDAGPPPPNTPDGAENHVTQKDLFAEDAGKPRPVEGSLEGLEGGLETDPTKVRAGDMYGARLGIFFHDRWQYPSVISQGEANRLCVVFQFNISPRMVIWHVRTDPVKKSGNDLFDDSARTMLLKLLDDRTALPEPPPELSDQFKGRTVNVALSGDLHGDSSRCR